MPPRAGFYHQQPVWQDLQGPATGINPPGAASDPTVETDLARVCCIGTTTCS